MERFNIVGTTDVLDTYMELSLSGVSGNIQTANIILYQNDPVKFRVWTTSVFNALNEYTTTGTPILSYPNNGPLADISQVVDASVPQAATSITFSVSVVVQSALNNGASYIAFHYAVPSSFDSSIAMYFNSRELLSYKPTLTIVHYF